MSAVSYFASLALLLTNPPAPASAPPPSDGSTVTINATAAVPLTVKLSNIEAPGKGTLVFLVFDSEETFPREHDRAIRRYEMTDFGRSASHTFTDLPAGRYAAVVFQDKNGNGEMDANFIGFPREPLVASGMEGMSRPSWKKCSFVLEGGGYTLNLQLFNQ